MKDGFTVCKGCSQRPVRLNDDQTHSCDLLECFYSKASYFITTVTHLTCIPQLELQSTSLTDSDIYPFHRPCSGQKGISKVKRNEGMGNRPNENRVLAKYPCHRHPPHTPLTVVQPIPFTAASYSPRRDLSLSLTQDTREEGDVPSRIHLHPHPRAQSLLNLQLLLHHHPPRVGSKTSPSLTQSWPYLPLVHPGILTQTATVL